MRRCRILLILSLAAGLPSCVTFPKSPEEFRSSAPERRDFFVNVSLTEAYELVARHTIRCHQGDFTVQIPVLAPCTYATLFFVEANGGSTRVKGALDEDKGTATVAMNFSNPTSSGLLQVIDFTRVDTEQTRVIAHQLNTARKWKTATASVEGYDEK